MPPKRRLSIDSAPAASSKRPRLVNSRDYLSRLSDELLIRVLGYLPISSLLLVQRLSHRFDTLANDSQLWKSLYYTRFVLPRALRLPSFRVSAQSNNTSKTPSTTAATAGPSEQAPLKSSPRNLKWLDEDVLVNRSDGKLTNWKGQYKLRHNWARGACELTEVQTGYRVLESGLLTSLVNGLVITIDLESGLRAWDVKTGSVVASLTPQGSRVPSALTTSSGGGIEGEGEDLCVAVGYTDGGFAVWSLDTRRGLFSELSNRAGSGSRNAKLEAISYSYPYLLCITEVQVLSLYSFKEATGPTNETRPEDHQRPNPAILDPAALRSQEKEAVARQGRLLTSLKSHTAWPPLTLSIRAMAQGIIAAVAYALPTHLRGWSVGLQELHLTFDGVMTKSRLTTAVQQGFHSLAPSNHNTAQDGSPSRGFGLDSTATVCPTSLSYSHPYLLASHPDNTLTLYLVNSSSDDLTISKGTKLWGHTSSVSGLQIGGRGKAVSISARANEVRVWELEGTTGPAAARRTASRSVTLRPEKWTRVPESTVGDEDSEDREDITLAYDPYADLGVRRDWVGFDDETVIVMKETDRNGHVLNVYDFT